MNPVPVGGDVADPRPGMVRSPSTIARPDADPRVLDEILLRLLRGDAKTKADVHQLKLDVTKEFRAVRVPSNPDVLARAADSDRARLLPLLRIKPTRSLSGVTIVTIQSSPEACPHGTCVFCPGGPAFGTAQSYTGKEPAARRALRHEFDPYDQTAGRLMDLHAAGHPVDKVDFIIQGGTFLARDEGYQRWFVKRSFDAMNEFQDADAAALRLSADPETTGTTDPASLLASQLANEERHARMIGLTVETKPDWCFEPHVDLALELGTTRIELGLQTLDDSILKATNRGHTVEDSRKSCRIVKDAGLKLCVHVMPGLPGADREKDLATFRSMAEDPDFAPDMIKIYPTLVIPGTGLHGLLKKGLFEPVREEYCVDLLAEAKLLLPDWVRIQRIDRDIPTPEIADGVKQTNLRQLVHDEMRKRGKMCRCIRCREAGRVDGIVGELTLVRQSYSAQGGTEHFLSYEDKERDALAAFVRVREPSDLAHRPEVADSVILRELKVMGSEVPIGFDEGVTPETEYQHKGLGRKLLAEAETIARDAGRSKVVVTAGVGVRPYYYKFGYERDGPYVSKRVT